MKKSTIALPPQALLLACASGLEVGLANGLLVTKLKVPAFIATLTLLLIGRGLVLALTSGRAINYSSKAADHGFFVLGENNAWDFNNQIIILLLVAVVGAVILARTHWGYETYATGGNLQAAGFAGINTDRVRIRAFIISALCATLAGLLNVAQDKAVTSQYGLGAELIVVAAVIVGGASILGGRGRAIGSCLGAILIVLIDKVLREGVPITRSMEIGGKVYEVQAMVQLPPGAVPAFLGLILLISVLIEPLLIRSGLLKRLIARLRGQSIAPRYRQRQRWHRGGADYQDCAICQRSSRLRPEKAADLPRSRCSNDYVAAVDLRFLSAPRFLGGTG